MPEGYTVVEQRSEEKRPVDFFCEIYVQSGLLHFFLGAINLSFVIMAAIFSGGSEGSKQGIGYYGVPALVLESIAQIWLAGDEMTWLFRGVRRRWPHLNPLPLLRFLTLGLLTRVFGAASGFPDEGLPPGLRFFLLWSSVFMIPALVVFARRVWELVWLIVVVLLMYVWSDIPEHGCTGVPLAFVLLFDVHVSLVPLPGIKPAMDLLQGATVAVMGLLAAFL